MKKIIKNWLKKFLEIDADNKKIQQEIVNLQLQNTEYERSLTILQREIINNKHLLESTRKLINVGVDIHDNRYGKSWAIVCLSGKTEIVNFYDLPYKDLVELNKILQQFKGTNVTVDASPYIRRHLDL